MVCGNRAVNQTDGDFTTPRGKIHQCRKFDLVKIVHFRDGYASFDQRCQRLFRCVVFNHARKVAETSIRPSNHFGSQLNLQQARIPTGALIRGSCR